MWCRGLGLSIYHAQLGADRGLEGVAENSSFEPSSLRGSNHPAPDPIAAAEAAAPEPTAKPATPKWRDEVSYTLNTGEGI